MASFELFTASCLNVKVFLLSGISVSTQGSSFVVALCNALLKVFRVRHS